jgi:hypothetical protein
VRLHDPGTQADWRGRVSIGIIKALFPYNKLRNLIRQALNYSDINYNSGIVNLMPHIGGHQQCPFVQYGGMNNQITIYKAQQTGSTPFLPQAI